MNLENVSTGKDRKTKSILMFGIVLAVFTIACLAMSGAVSAADDSGTAVGSEDVKTVSMADSGNMNAVSGSILSPLNGRVPITVMDENGLRDALEGKELEVILGADIVLSEPIDIKRSIFIDLNGHNLKRNVGAGLIFTLSSANLVLKDTSTKFIDRLFMSGDCVYADRNGYSKISDFKTVMDEKSLKEAVEAGANVKLGAPIIMSSQLDITNNVILDLDGYELRFSNKHHVYVHPNQRLTINDSSNPSTGKIMGGHSDGSGGCIFVGGGGKLTLNNGTIQDGEVKNHGGGVYVDHGTFEMNGGAIIGNDGEIIAGCIYAAGDNGGGVYMNGGTFEMYDGIISSNTARDNGGGVYLNNGAKFTMYDGAIRYNWSYSDNGGGVYVNNGSEFTMKGGTIYHNIGNNYGAGVYVNNNSKFTLESGEIYENYFNNNWSEFSKGGLNGAGVFVKNSEFTMNGGTISNNKADDYGGGVYLDTGAKFTMNGGTISNNLAREDDGAGVCVMEGGKFIMTDGIIENNTAKYVDGWMNEAYGGGVYVRGGEFEMIGGIIKNNKAKNDGGGVFVCENGKMVISGSAKITGNKKLYGKTAAANLGLDSGGTLTLDGNLRGEIRICSPNPQEGTEFGIATSGASGAEKIRSEDGKLVGAISDGKLIWKKVSGTDSESEVKTSSSSTLTSLFDEKSCDNFTFKRPIVITKATLPGAASATITNTSGSGWYTCHMVPVPASTSVALKSMNSPMMVFSTSRFH